jgi:formylglycine-generating enzyme required for sulfatase activity
VLDPRQLIARRKVVPRDPDQSKLYRKLTDKDDPMPPADVERRPTADEIAAVRKWIEDGAKDFQPARPAREFISESAVLDAIAKDLQEARPHARPQRRYFTITHLYNAGLAEDELQTYRFALAKLVNSLSWGPRVQVPVAIDAARTVFRIELDFYGWKPQQWEQVLAAYPYGVTYRTPQALSCYEQTRCPLPYVRADWFVFEASRPPLYHDLLGLPKTAPELETLLGVDVAKDIRDEQAQRAAFSESGISASNRVIERHDIPRGGAYWKTYDFKNDNGRRNVFAHPLGPGDDPGSFTHDGGEIIFSLPNGLQGYMLVDDKGQRLNQGPANIVTDPKQRDKAVVNGISCMTCHDRGIKEKDDEIRAHVAKNAGAFRKEAEAIRSLYVPQETFRKFLRRDAERFAAAVRELEGPPVATDPIFALSQRYEWPLDLGTAAAEVGVRPSAFREGLQDAPLRESARSLLPLLQDGKAVKRDVLREHFGALVRELLPGAEHYQPGKGELVNSVGMPLRLIPAGQFTMGSPTGETDRGRDEDAHRVEITRAFYLGKFPVTQRQYEKVMGENPSYFSPRGKGAAEVRGLKTEDFPVENVSWNDAAEFCRRLSELPAERAAGRRYRLPTEAEWEYACRAGTTTPFHFGASLTPNLARFDGRRPYGEGAARAADPAARPAAVGSSGGPNDFGLFDMHGNVQQWCQDWYDPHYYAGSPKADPQGPAAAKVYRVLRGGSWFDAAKDCRSAARGYSAPVIESKLFGFRVVLGPPDKAP